MFAAATKETCTTDASRGSLSLTVMEERDSVEHVGVVLSCPQRSCDGELSTEAVLDENTTSFPLTTSTSLDGEEFSSDVEHCCATTKTAIPSFWLPTEIAFQSPLSVIEEDLMSDNESFYDESSSSFDAFYGEGAIRSIDNTIPSLRELRETDIFDNRYRIEPGAASRIWRRMAIDTYTRQKVTLRFYPNAKRLFKTVSSMHEHLSQENCVCKLLATIANVPGFPPCHVFERGDFTLTQVLREEHSSPMGRRGILFHILEVLEHLHNKEIVHGDLTPEKIMWFSSDMKWKLSDLDTARWIGSGSILASSLEFASPELVQSTKRRMPLSPHGSADLWSVGIIAHELLTGKPFYPPNTSAMYVEDVLALKTELPKVQAYGQAERDFLYQLLSTNPKTRLEAKAAGQSSIFTLEGGSSSHTKDDDGEIVGEKTPKTKRVRQDKTVKSKVARLGVSIRIERFRKRGNPFEPFESREGKDVSSTTCGSLPKQNVHFLRYAESHRLRICIEDEQDTSSLSKVEVVTVKLPDASPVDLPTVVTKHDAKRQEIVALLDLRRCDSTTTHRVSPYPGGIEKPYTKMKVKIRMHRMDDASWGFDLTRTVYFKIVHRRRHVLYRKLTCATRKWWGSVSQWTRKGARIFAHEHRAWVKHVHGK